MGEENLHSCNQSQAWNAATMQIRNVHDLGMTNLLTQETARDFLRAAIQRSGLKPSQLAKKAGVAPSTITRPLSDPLYEFIPKASTLAKIAEASGEELPIIFRPAPDSFSMPSNAAEDVLPIRYEAAAGAWLATDEQHDQPLGEETVRKLWRFNGYPQWMERVVGDSMDKRLPPGTLVHVVDAIALHYEPRHGDIVVVVRSRAQGAFLERSIKEVVIDRGHVELWPRSHNPRWSEPLSPTQGVREGEDVEVEIRGLVVQAYFTLFE
jgi:transcriptional regulator with XRE-family HTH domain